jgi:hypothetical protein
MTEKQLQRAGAVTAAGVAVLSVVYAVAYLVITPSAQRGSNTDAALRSYLGSPAGLRIAASCLLISGLAIPVAWVALARRLEASTPTAAALVRLLGVVAGLATAAHGLADLIGLDKLAHSYASGDAAAKAAVGVDAVLPKSTDPRGLFTFGVAGAAVLVAALILRSSADRLGTLGVVLGVDMMLLFVATAVGIGPLVLVTGGLASVVLGPWWWVSIARRLLQPLDARPSYPPGTVGSRPLAAQGSA